jgi:hypothetical protein
LGATIATYDNISGVDGNVLYKLAETTNTAYGDALIGVKRTLTGAVATTQHAWHEAQIVNVKTDFGAVGDGSTNDTAAIQAALDALEGTGGIIFFPPGTYKITSALVIYQEITLIGCGRGVSIITSAHTGNGITSTWPINSSTIANIYIRDLTIQNTNGSNTGAGFVDVGGTFIELERVQIIGFYHNVILDQSELVDFKTCDFEVPLYSWAWLANTTYTGGASAGFTNRIGFHTCQFNGTVGAVLDDGGTAHTFNDCNFNGGSNHIRACGVSGLKINGGEFESASSTNILFSNLAWGGASIGACIGVEIGGAAQIIPSTGQSCINFSASGISQVQLGNITFGTSSAAKVINTSNCGVLNVIGPVHNAGGGNTFDGYATYHTELGLAGRINMSTTTWTPTDASGAGLSLTIADAKYQRVGQMILGEALITYPATADASAAKIGGFPVAGWTGGISVTVLRTDSACTFANGASGASSVSLLTSAGTVTNANMSGKVIKIGFSYFI